MNEKTTDDNEHEADATRRSTPSDPLRATPKALADVRENIVLPARIALSNALDAIDRGDDDPAMSDQVAVLEALLEEVATLERHVDKALVKCVKGHPMFGRVTAIRGVGPFLAARILTQIDPHLVASKPSALWKWAGMAVVSGRADRPTKGQRLQYSPRLKVCCYLLGESMIKTGSPYRQDYDAAKARYQERAAELQLRRAESKAALAAGGLTDEQAAAHQAIVDDKRFSPIHVHKMAMRCMVKLFLAHLWEEWMIELGLPVRPPYSHERQGHTTKIEPHERGWPRREERAA